MHITQLWRRYGNGAKWFCVSTKSRSGEWEDHFFRRNELGAVMPFVRENAGKNVYFCPHGFSSPRRLKEHAVAPRLLWSDMDEANPRSCKLKPTLAFESSPGRYVGLWLLDGTMDESMNRRLAYYIDADKSGWDFTQVLRFPGSLNHKYPVAPRVRTIITDGPSYKVSELSESLPKESRKDSGSEYDSSAILKQYHSALKPQLRQLLMERRKPAEGKRSEMLWKIINGLVEAGLSKEEVLTVAGASVWNKFRGRRGEQEQLEREFDKALNNHSQGSRVELEDDNEFHLTAQAVCDAEEANIDWVWYRYLARGEVSILEGDPQAGKSYLTMMIASRICRGEALPTDDKGLSPVKGSVVYFDLENSINTVTKKRLRWHGYGDLDNFHQVMTLFSVDNEQAIEAVHSLLGKIKPALVVFDTMNTYIGQADTSQGAQGQQAFMKFVEIARSHNAAVLVLRHLTKGGRDKAIYRGQGNIAFVGVSRTVMLAGMHPEEPGVRVVAQSKNNLTRLAPSFTYEIIDRSTKKEPERSEFKFGDVVDMTADQLASSTTAPTANDEDDTAGETFLLDTLKAGPTELSRILRMAERSSITEKQLHAAAEELGIVKTKEGRRTIWSLPG